MWTDALPERLRLKITADPDTGCWLWDAHLNCDGYGMCWLFSRMGIAHRQIWRLLVGPLPRSIELHHECDVRRCVNPAHLTPLTRSEHRARHRDPELCVHGHPRTPANTYVRRNGVRMCRPCKAAIQRRQHAKDPARQIAARQERRDRQRARERTAS